VRIDLKPVRLMGVESQGMILAAEDKGAVYLLRPDKKVNREALSGNACPVE